MAFGDPNPSYSLPMVTPGAGFNAMLTRFYDEFGNVQGRNEKAFGYYEAEKQREADAYQRMIREQELAREKERRDYNQRQMDMAAQRQEARRQESRAAMEARVNDPQRRFWNTRNALDAMTQHGRVGLNMSGDNAGFQNFPAASALTFGQNIFPTKDAWSMYNLAVENTNPGLQAEWGQENTGNPEFRGGGTDQGRNRGLAPGSRGRGNSY